MKKLQAILFMLTSTVFLSCEKTAVQESGCYETRKTVKEAENIKGRIEKLGGNYPDVWCIVSLEGVIGSQQVYYDTNDIILPCNLPDELKVANTEVLFSGQLKSVDDDFNQPDDKDWSKHAYYTKLSKIEKLK